MRIVALFALSWMSAFGVAWAEEPLLTDAQFRQLAQRFQIPEPGHALLKPITDAEDRDDNVLVVKLSNELIQKPLTEFDSSQYGIALKSMAYMHRGRAQAIISGEIQPYLEDFDRSASLGNLQAMEDLIKLCMTSAMGKASPGQEVDEPESKLRKYTHLAAPLGDPLSGILLGMGKLDPSLGSEEKAFWLLLGVAHDNLPPERKRKTIDDFSEALGSGKLERGIAQFGLTKVLDPDSELGLPGRNAVDTMFVEADLRGTFQRLLGIIRATGTIPEAPTLKENWQLYRYLVDSTGFGSAYLLIPGNNDSRDGHMIVRSRAAVSSNINAGDRVFVRCGPLSHVAMVYSVDRAKGEVLFADAAYQFWQKEQNACITSFRLVASDAARPLTSVSMDDVTRVLEAIITVRDRD
ncbi:hypothetical protein [Rhizobium sp. P44RR-XXIV]|uniref:hypothetical protein n=1 Tax=Rhizobium sp. P44RR-XXIV TaxID=1921145 RepID=UPI0010AA9B9C|nr:hypothetical protein [Rhizobium sp. P44RR-XXIV]TIX91116.1 hypothetical protein BSK43_008975 [Rhizobium sp. P44RR-XXIV]